MVSRKTMERIREIEERLKEELDLEKSLQNYEVWLEHKDILNPDAYPRHTKESISEEAVTEFINQVPDKCAGCDAQKQLRLVKMEYGGVEWLCKTCMYQSADIISKKDLD